MDSHAKMTDRKFAYSDYRNWPQEERWELIDGDPWCMTPAPSTRHQRIVQRLIVGLELFFAGKPGTPFVSPTDVVLDDHNVVQPDLLVVCDSGKITEESIQGAPDLVIEVLSPATGLKDKREKKSLYERCGVGEYLLFHPGDETVDRFRLAEGRYGAAEVYNWDEGLSSHLFPGLSLNLWEIFGEEPPAEGARGAVPGEAR